MDINVRRPILITAIVQSILLLCLNHFIHLSQPLTAGLNTLVIYTLLSYQLGFNRRNQLGLSITAAIFGLLFGFSLYYMHRWHYNWDNVASWQLIFFSMYIVYCLNVVYQNSKKVWFPYHDLFETAWNALISLAIAAIFTGLFWLIIAIWSELFDIIGIRFFETVFYSAIFSYLSTPIVFGVGLIIAREHAKVITALRNILFAIAYFLLPIVAIFSLLFLVSLPLSTNHANEDLFHGMYITLTIVAIILINAVFQDGHRQAPYHRFLRYVINLFIIILPFYPISALIGCVIETQHTNLIPCEVEAIVTHFLLCLYAISYLIAIVASGKKWLRPLPLFNILLAFITVAVSWLLCSPVLNSNKLASDRQRFLLLHEVPHKVKNEALYLCHADLSHAQLANKNLRNANLSYANLSHANLRGADLQNANLTHANLNAANLNEANLTSCQMNGVNIANATFKGANLSYTSIPHPHGIRKDQFSGACSNTRSLNDGHPTHLPLCSKISQAKRYTNKKAAF